jgi:meso-butanediol dehydrogenase / (S,S)-butanediol dehydrogenase / diacetyl reductase
MKIDSKVALITGGGTGIGAAIAKRFVEEGATVCITGRRQEMLDEVAKALPSDKVTTCAGDVSKETDVRKMVESAVAFGGGLDVLINNAAMSANGPVGELDPEVWRQVIAVNQTGPFLMMQASIPHMIERGGGSIINVASVGGMRCLPGMPAYCSSKAGLIMLTQQAALDYGPQKIRCNAICPGGIKTAMTEKEFGQFGEMLGMDVDKFFAKISSELPLKRFGQPQEISGLCVYLASDEASFMTGASLVIDAGTSVVDVVGASIMRSLRDGGLIPG